MLIYNYQKEFLGIDEGDLKALGFSNLAELRKESADFADLFVKTPGFVHNFKHVHWIDFVTCAESNTDSKVIIHANGKNYKCTLDIRPSYLVDNPTKKAYLIHLMQLRALTHGENEEVASDVLEKPAPLATTQDSAIFNTLEAINNSHNNTIRENQELRITPDPYELESSETLDKLDINPNIVEDVYEDTPIEIGDELLTLDEIEEESAYEDEVEQIAEVTKVIKTPEIKIHQETIPDSISSYIYDPHLASEELGLPVDLIEEFIQDFVSQAYEFKENLYRSLKEDDLENVKILSHKLKGVAANLRVEDAFETLSVINTSDEIDEIETNMNILYVIIDKLAGKEIQEPVSLEQTKAPEKTPEPKMVIEKKVEVADVIEDIPEISTDSVIEEDDLMLSFKDDIDIDEEIQIEEKTEEFKEVIEENSEDLTLSFKDDISINEEIKIEDKAKKSIKVVKEIPDDLIEIEIDEVSENIEVAKEVEEAEEVPEKPELDIAEEIVKEKPKVLYNKSIAASEIGIDKESFNELFEDYLIEASKICDNITKAIEEDNSGLWARIALKLKGMSDNMRIHDFTGELESIIHTKHKNIAKTAVEQISTKLEQISSKEV